MLSRALTQRNTSVGADEVYELFPPIFPWVARFAPATAQRLSREFWSYAIHSANPGGAALSAPILPLMSVHLDQLVNEINAATIHLRSARNLGPFLTRLSKVFLFSDDESTIIRWFETMLALPTERDREEWQILPVPTMLEKMATPTLANACWQRFEVARAEFQERPDDRRVRYWLKLYACLVGGDAGAGDRALRLVRTLPVGHPWAATLTQIVAISGDAAVVDNALRDLEFRRHFADAKATHHFAWFLRLPVSTRLSPEVWDLLPQLPPTVAAELLRWSNGENEHLPFARMLAACALRRAGGTSTMFEPGFELRWTRAHGDHRTWWRIDEAQHESNTSHSPLSSVWGVNREAHLRGTALDENREAVVEEQNRQLNNAAKRAREKMEVIVDQYLVRFHGRHTLERWAVLNPDEFRNFAHSFCACMGKNQLKDFELAPFCADVLATMCTLDVVVADQLNEQLYGGSRGTMTIDGIVPSFLFRIMEHDLDGQKPAITAIRMKLFARCRNDRDVLAIVTAALHGQTIDWLRQHARESFGSSPFARERTLAVSLLAFADRDEDRAWLANLATVDHSHWVRDHAAWALEFHDQSSAARCLWNETVAEIQRPGSDLLLVSTRLVRLKALLPPTAILWNRPHGPNPSVNALVAAFWYSWQNHGGTKAEREICRRKLNEYFRGERITDVAKRMAPWWQP
jgi:hypothetical protein